MEDENDGRLETIVTSSSTPKGIDKKPRRSKRRRVLDGIVASYHCLTNMKNLKKAGSGFIKYVSNKQRVKAAAILGASLAGVALLKDKLPEVTEYFQNTVPFLTDSLASLTVDVVGNAIMAPVGFLLSKYVNGEKITKKEFIGQAAFAAAWGVARHYTYSGLNMVGTAPRIPLYVAYYAAYGGIYATFSDLWGRVCHGEKLVGAVKNAGNNFKNKLTALGKDPSIQLNLAMNLANILINPWKESQPTLGGALLIHYNMDVLKHADTRSKLGFIDYLKGIFVGSGYEKAAPQQIPRTVIPKSRKASAWQRIYGSSEKMLGMAITATGLSYPLLPLGLSAYSFYQQEVAHALTYIGLSGILSPAAHYSWRLGKYLRAIGSARLKGLTGDELEQVKFRELSIFTPQGKEVLNTYIERRWGPEATSDQRN